jgi:3-oxosteroid 1-dehydrogenase
MTPKIAWDNETEVVVVGYGGAGAVTAIAAHDAGAEVLILEKQASDTPVKTNHTPNTRMSGGHWFCPVDTEKTIAYLEAMVKVSNESLDSERREMISVFARYLTGNTDWMKSIGGQTVADPGSGISGEVLSDKEDTPLKRGRHDAGKIFLADLPHLPGSESSAFDSARTTGKYRNGAAFFKFLSDAVESRKIKILWETSGSHLIMNGGEVIGIEAKSKDKVIRVKASRAVVLTCGGFEFNEVMKQNYLRAYPAYFTGNPGNSGDGISMAMEVGANLWHMNNASWRVAMKFPEFQCGFATQRHETRSIFVDKKGNRFANERYELHTFGYALTDYDSHIACYPKNPCYWVFDEKRRMLGPLASYGGNCNPPGGIMGDIFYIWSEDNTREIDRGWIMKSNTLEGLARQIKSDPDNLGLLETANLAAALKRYNELCQKGEDNDFHKPGEWLQPLEGPPYYAVKLWLGGPNTQGGPKRNTRAQIVRVDGKPIPRLYSAGEMGSVWSMLYQGSGNLGECIAFGRIAGANAAAEKPWK